MMLAMAIMLATLASPARAVEPLFQPGDLQILYGNVQRPNAMTYLDGKLYVACSGDWTVYEIDIETEETRTYIFGLQNANSLFAETGRDGLTQIWAADFATNDFLRIHPEISPVRIVEDGLAGGWGMAYLDEQRFLVSNLLSDNLMAVSRFGETEILLERLRSPTGLALDGGAVYVANTGSARRSIEWYTLRQLRDHRSDTATPLDSRDVPGASLVRGLQNVTGLALAADGWLYFAYSEGARGTIGRVNAHHCRDAGGCEATDVEPVVRTNLPAPLAGLTLTPDGRLFFHSLYQPEIYWLSLPGAAASAEGSESETGGETERVSGS